jgi:(2Fe-2S) ferredoxin
VLSTLREELGRHGLADHVIVSSTGCLGACEHGPVVIVYPESIWYGAVKPGDVSEIVASHLKAGRPVERLMLTGEAALRGEILDHREKYFAMMRAKDAAGIVPEDFNETVRAFMPSRAILSALELDLFTSVRDGATAAQVAQKQGTDTRAIPRAWGPFAQCRKPRPEASPRTAPVP